MSTQTSAYVSGYEIKGVIYLNADQVALALMKAGAQSAAELVEMARDLVRQNVSR